MTFRTAFVTTVMLLACGASALAQSPRVVLVEEATNASCAPCAAQNPTFKAYLHKPYNAERIIPVIWHANWPSRDVMNAANPTMHNTRIATYYAINSVPMVKVNGRTPAQGSIYAGAPADTVELSKAIARDLGTSPITIAVSQVENGDEVTVTTEVSSTTPVTGKKLRVVVVEASHYYDNAGSNGEKLFQYIAREALPTVAGVDLTLDAGTPKSFTNTFTYNAEWNRSEIYVVAFVQDDATKEVLQAATNKQRVTFELAGPASQLSVDVNTPTEFTGVITAEKAGDYMVEITTAVPAGWTAQAIYNGAPMTSGQKITLGEGQSADISALITPAASKNRRGEIVVTVKGPLGASASQTCRLYARDIDVLVGAVDEGNAQITDYYTKALDRTTTTYAFAELDDALAGLFMPNDFKVLFVEVGRNVLEMPTVEVMKAYLDAGGRLFLTGAEIAWALVDPEAVQYGFYQDPAFLRDYLKAAYVADDANEGTVRGVDGDPVSAGFSLNILAGVQNQETPDQISPLAGATTIFTYGTNVNSVAGIRYDDGKNRVIYLGFGLEGILSHATRGQVIEKGVQWLINGTPTDVEAVDVIAPRTVDAYPQPVRGTLNVPVTLDRAEAVRVAVYDLTGRVRATDEARLAAGSHTRMLDVSALPNGVYMLHVTRGTERMSRTITIVR